MHSGNLTALEIQSAHKNEHQHIIEIMEHWLNAYDRGELYNLRDAYEDTLGFNNADKLEAWQVDSIENLNLSLLKSLQDCSCKTLANLQISASSSNVV